MTQRKLPLRVMPCLALILAQSVLAEPKLYPDGHGGEVAFPLGDASFADQVERYVSGDPAPRKSARDPQAALGIPDVEGSRSGYVTLGCAGELVLNFDDNALIDVAGPDLYVFEIGPDVEPTALAVSNDGEEWLRVGRISGGKSEIDLAPYVNGETDFRYVRLVDLKSACGGQTPGADIDAVGAMGSAERIALDSAVLFDSGEYALRPEASAAIDAALSGIEQRQATRVVVAGHTDSVGNADNNMTLSRNRARSVADYLTGNGGFAEDRVTLEAHGESRPVAGNDTAEGRARNRRVELTLRAPRQDSGEEIAHIEILGVWDASDRIVEIRRVDGEFEGDYTSDGGRLRGEFISETVFEGYWVEDNSGRACDTVKAGSDHWGPIRMEFDSPELETFSAQWRYCGEDEWRGEWQPGQRLL